jgi:ribosomal-protein-alanine N-acetyltransferase
VNGGIADMFGWLHRRPASAVRPLVAADCLLCAEIHAEAFAHPWTADDFERLLSAGNTVADGVLAGRRHAIAGFVLSHRAADEAEILSLAVAAAWRRRGCARALLGAHCSRLAGRGVKVLSLEVEANNTAAIELYRQFGFRQAGERKGYYRSAEGTRSNALILRRAFD